METYYKPTNDYMFKRIFGYKRNSALLQDLLEGILPDLNFKDLRIKHQFTLEKEILLDKLGVLDIVATLTDGTQVNIEMQVKNYENLVDRSLFYETGIFHESLRQSEDYNKIPRTIGIWILDHNIFDIGPFHEIARLRRDYEDIILTEKLELHYIQLPKFKEKCKRISSKLEQWLTFIINDNLEEIAMMDNKYIKKAEEELELLNSDEKEKELARLREKAIRDENAAIAGALERGIMQGIEQGIEQGQNQKAIQIAKKMIEEKIDIETIVKITGLTREEIEKS